MKRQWLGVWAVVFLGIIFVVAGTSKALMPSGNFPLLLQWFLPSFLAQAISITVPYMEIIVGVLLIFGIAVKPVTSLSTIMIAGFVVSNLLLINLGLAAEPCGCFGGVGGKLSVEASLMLDGVMATMALIIFLFHPDGFKSIKPWCLTSEQNTIGKGNIIVPFGKVVNE